MTQPLGFPDQPTHPVTERRLDMVERRSLTQAAVNSSLVSDGGVFRVLWSVNGPLTAGQSNVFPFFDGDEASLALAWARIASTTSSGSTLEVRRNGIAVATLTVPSGTGMEELALPSEAFAAGDALTFAVTGVGTSAEDLQMLARFQ